jgi:hypothetical protein
MTTTYRPSFADLLCPDTSGNVFWQPASILDTNDLYPAWQPLIYTDTATHDKAFARFSVPKNYTGNSKIIVRYKTTATSGNALWTVNYTSIAVGETGDPAAAQETLAGTATAVPVTANVLADVPFTLTAANLAADDTILIAIGRNGAGADTVAASLQLVDAFLEYDG